MDTNVTPSQHNYTPFDIDTFYGTVTLQRTGPFGYRARMGDDFIGYVYVNHAGSETLYAAMNEARNTEWQRETHAACADALSLHATENQ